MQIDLLIVIRQGGRYDNAFAAEDTATRKKFMRHSGMFGGEISGTQQCGRAVRHNARLSHREFGMSSNTYLQSL